MILNTYAPRYCSAIVQSFSVLPLRLVASTGLYSDTIGEEPYRTR